jgi:hypothetical protein
MTEHRGLLADYREVERANVVHLLPADDGPAWCV